MSEQTPSEPSPLPPPPEPERLYAADITVTTGKTKSTQRIISDEPIKVEVVQDLAN